MEVFICPLFSCNVFSGDPGTWDLKLILPEPNIENINLNLLLFLLKDGKRHNKWIINDVLYSTFSYSNFSCHFVLVTYRIGNIVVLVTFRLLTFYIGNISYR